jgi:hypothetical protein
MSTFVVKFIVIQIKGQSRDLSINLNYPFDYSSQIPVYSPGLFIHHTKLFPWETHGNFRLRILFE